MDIWIKSVQEEVMPILLPVAVVLPVLDPQPEVATFVLGFLHIWPLVEHLVVLTILTQLLISHLLRLLGGHPVLVKLPVLPEEVVFTILVCITPLVAL